MAKMPEGDSDLESIRDSITPVPQVETVVHRPPAAWQPFTPAGVAAFALAPLRRLLMVELIFGLLAVLGINLFLLIGWLPVAEEAVSLLPDTGLIHDGQLLSPRSSPEPLALSPLIGFAVDLDQRSNADVGTDLYLKFHRTNVQVCGALGCVEVNYPRGWLILFNRTELQAWWGAWKLMIHAAFSVVLLGLLFVQWALLAACYTPVVWLVARAAGRRPGLRPSWRMASAALMPGALFLVASLILYGTGTLSLAAFALCVVGHLLLGPVYVFLAPKHLPAAPVVASTAQGANPFAPPSAAGEAPPVAPRKKRPQNVFRPDE